MQNAIGNTAKVGQLSLSSLSGYKKAAVHFRSSSAIKKEIVKDLETRDLVEANKRKLAALASMRTAD